MTLAVVLDKYKKKTRLSIKARIVPWTGGFLSRSNNKTS
jgi:hypothetical protein